MIGNLYKIINREHLHRIAIDTDEKDVSKILFDLVEPDTIEYEIDKFSENTYSYHILKENDEEIIYIFTTLSISADIQVT